MGILQKFESRLEQMVSGVFAKAFRSAVQPVEVAAALQREVDNSAQILSRNRRLVPNQFHVELSEQDHERLAPYSSTLAQELTEIAVVRLRTAGRRKAFHVHRRPHAPSSNQIQRSVNRRAAQVIFGTLDGRGRIIPADHP